MTTLLAIDTGQAACSVALWREGAVAGHRLLPMPKGHAEALVPMIEEVQSETGFAFEGLDALAVTVGPGTFTGLRVGLATARGLAVAAGKPLIGVTTLEAIAWPVRREAEEGTAIVASFDARRNEAYLQCFAPDGTGLTEPALVSLDDVTAHVPDLPLLCVGTGAELVRDRLSEHTHPIGLSSAAPLPDARVVAEIAAGRLPEADGLPGPLYLRAPDAKLPTKPLLGSTTGPS
ncbi:MAG: tRNA (adenosine(37)-N6)-threonylcarbamoyltransferase complex dimerization subunit type 1 TsaB [Rhodobiaceae bacterium]|nr:tRNA (adenosine(37)-N6)-threonylcarbamoyltransferase complex dimerization subunit type 1 TsaB [Rhodobiaceae bacterium]